MTDIAVSVQEAAAISPASVNAEPAGDRPAPPVPPAQPARAARTHAGWTEIARSAALRSARTFLQAFLAVVTASPVLDLNVSVLESGATAGLAAVLTLAQRLLDETNIPTVPAG